MWCGLEDVRHEREALLWRITRALNSRMGKVLAESIYSESYPIFDHITFHTRSLAYELMYKVQQCRLIIHIFVDSIQLQD